MTHRSVRFALAVALAAAAAPAVTSSAGPAAAAAEPPPQAAAAPIRVETLRIEPRAPTPADRAPPAYEALFSKPPAWSAGGPAVVVLWEEPGRDDLRDRMVAAMLDEEGAAVLELDAHAARGISPDSAFAPPPPAPYDLLPDLFAALEALRRDAHAGAEVSAVGYGAAGAAAVLLAAREENAAAHLGAKGPRFSGLAALGPGSLAFALGGGREVGSQAPPPPRSLCGALASAIAPVGARWSLPAEAAEACTAPAHAGAPGLAGRR